MIEPTSDAYRVLCGDTDPEWHAHRRALVTGSAAAQLLGRHRYGSLLATYLRMRGVEAEDDHTEEHAAWMRWCRRQEAQILEDLREERGLVAHRAGQLIVSTRHPWAGCTLDGWVRDPDDEGRHLPVEIKVSRSREVAAAWEEGAPPDVVAQCQWAMLITDTPRCLVAVSLFGDRPRWQWIARDAQAGDELVCAGKALWSQVQRGDPPEPDGTRSADKAIERMAGPASGAMAHLTAEHAEMSVRIKELGEQARAAEQEKRRLTQTIRVAMGSASVGALPGGGAWKVIELPEQLVEAHTRAASSYIRWVRA